MKFLTSIDLNKNELQNAKIQSLATAPSSPAAGQLYFDTTSKQLMVWNGTQWAAGGADIPELIISNVAGLQTALDKKYDKTTAVADLAKKADKATVTSDLALKADKTAVTSDIAAALLEAKTDSTAKSDASLANGKKYTDAEVVKINTSVSGHVSTLNTAINKKENTGVAATEAAAALASAKTHANSRIDTEVLGATGAVAVEKAALIKLINAKEAIGVAATKASQALADAKTYADAQITAKAYVHPASHPATMITESAAKRFVSDTEKGKWTAKWDYDELTIKGVKVNAAVNSDTVGGLTVKTAVPTGAKFTDTTYTKASLGLGNVDNTSDAAKPVSTAVTAALGLKADTSALETEIENAVSSMTTYSDQLITDLIGGAPEDLDTLKELADALANDAQYSTTLLSKLKQKTEKKVQTLGDGVKTSFLVPHELNTRDVTVMIRQTGAPYEAVYTDIEMTSVDSITVFFAKAPILNEYTVTIVG